MRRRVLPSIAGERFGDLVAVEPHSRDKYGHSLWTFACDCGTKTVRRRSSVESGRALSCGCKGGNKNIDFTKLKHGFARRKKERFWLVWYGMKRRCHDPKYGKNFERYGGKGIKVCERWHEFLAFKEDMFDSYQRHISEFPNNTQIDRIDPKQGYSLENCRWVTQQENLKNRVFKKS